MSPAARVEIAPRPAEPWTPLEAAVATEASLPPQAAPLRPQASNLRPPQVTAIIGTRNEEHKIRTALTHCLQWADEVVVVDKDSSDCTPAIAREMGARVVNAGFSRQGHESVAEQVSHASHDWVWIWTSHEVPTPGLIEAGRFLISDAVDLIMVPMHYYSFGVHDAASPWAGGWQPRLFHRRRVTYTGIAHDPLRAARIRRIEYDPARYVLHQTHAPVDRFLLSHLDYAVNEAARDTPERVLAQAFANIRQYQPVFEAKPELLGQQLGWHCYWMMVALYAWERQHPGLPAKYATRGQEMLARHWPARPGS